MRPRRKEEELEPEVDPSGWLLANDLAQFMILHTNEIKYMCMFGYTFMHGVKVFGKLSPNAPFSYRFVSMILACTGGGIMVPIFINSVPVPLSTDAYPIAIFVSFALHSAFPVLRQVFKLSPLFKGVIVFLYEVARAYVVVKLTKAAGYAIPPSEFSIPVFGPIFCGSIAGCGGAFLPLNKGLEPLKDGMAPNMLSAFVAATFYHLFLHTSLSDGVKDAASKAHVVVATFFVVYGMIISFQIDVMAPFKGKPKESETAKAKVKKEN